MGTMYWRERTKDVCTSSGLGARTWKWADCSPWEITFWRSGEPNNHLGPQDCLNYHPEDRKWDDIQCNSKAGFLCSQQICPGEAATIRTTTDSAITTTGAEVPSGPLAEPSKTTSTTTTGSIQRVGTL